MVTLRGTIPVPKYTGDYLIAEFKDWKIKSWTNLRAQWVSDKFSKSNKFLVELTDFMDIYGLRFFQRCSDLFGIENKMTKIWNQSFEWMISRHRTILFTINTDILFYSVLPWAQNLKFEGRHEYNNMMLSSNVIIYSLII